jgi:hypothetical protein
MRVAARTVVVSREWPLRVGWRETFPSTRRSSCKPIPPSTPSPTPSISRSTNPASSRVPCPVRRRKLSHLRQARLPKMRSRSVDPSVTTSAGSSEIRETPCKSELDSAVNKIRKAVRCLPSAFSTGFCHAAAGAAIHLRATPVLKASVWFRLFVPVLFQVRSTQRESPARTRRTEPAENLLLAASTFLRRQTALQGADNPHRRPGRRARLPPRLWRND